VKGWLLQVSKYKISNPNKKKLEKLLLSLFLKKMVLSSPETLHKILKKLKSKNTTSKCQTDKPNIFCR